MGFKLKFVLFCLCALIGACTPHSGSRFIPKSAERRVAAADEKKTDLEIDPIGVWLKGATTPGHELVTSARPDEKSRWPRKNPTKKTTKKPTKKATKKPTEKPSMEINENGTDQLAWKTAQPDVKGFFHKKNDIPPENCICISGGECYTNSPQMTARPKHKKTSLTPTNNRN